jgi:hypothetical protein|tara:strand:+ start:8733 stop:8876 length:144 start_codon:yes stop_codon:yes gene_type:complete
MKNYFNFSLTEKQKLRDFANKITPPNWHVYLTEEAAGRCLGKKILAL